jgi:hypothetical protein
MSRCLSKPIYPKSLEINNYSMCRLPLKHGLLLQYKDMNRKESRVAIITNSIPAANGDLAPMKVAGPITVVYSATALTKQAWSAPTAPGTYYIVLDENGNGHYNPSSGEEVSAALQ